MRPPTDTTFDNRDPYQVLGVARGAAPELIRKAYLSLARRHHPNLFATDPEQYRAATELMQDVNGAYDLLSDPARREMWDRRHSVAPRPAPRRPPPVRSKYYDPDAVHLVIRKYNEFVASLRTVEERRASARDITRFHSSRAGTAYIHELVRRQYGAIIDLVKLGRWLKFYDDGLVEIMYLYPGAIEVAPNEVFITYAYVLYRENRGRPPDGPSQQPASPARGQDETEVRLRLPGPRGRPTTKTSKPGSCVGSKVWAWLMAKPEDENRSGF